MFREYIIFLILTKCLRGPDETVSRAVVWRPLIYGICCFLFNQHGDSKRSWAELGGP